MRPVQGRCDSCYHPLDEHILVRQEGGRPNGPRLGRCQARVRGRPCHCEVTLADPSPRPTSEYRDSEDGA